MIVHKELVDISFWQKCNIQELELTKMYWKQHTGIAFMSLISSSYHLVQYSLTIALILKLFSLLMMVEYVVYKTILETSF